MCPDCLAYFLSSKPAESEGKGWQEAMTFHNFIPVETHTRTALEELSLHRHQNKSMRIHMERYRQVFSKAQGSQESKSATDKQDLAGPGDDG